MKTKIDKYLAQDITNIIFIGFEDYLSNFRLITRQVRFHFSREDFHTIQSETARRLTLYKDKVKEIALDVESRMGVFAKEKHFWVNIKDTFNKRNSERTDFEIIETFYNSICRKVTNTVDEDIMFIFPGHPDRFLESEKPIFYTYRGDKRPLQIVWDIMTDFTFEKPWENMVRDMSLVTGRIYDEILSNYQADEKTRVEVLKSVFYRNKGCYIVGRIFIGDSYHPFLLPVLYRDDKMYIDTFVSDPDDVSIIFSFTRSYFMVEVEVPSEFVRFLQTLMPQKSKSELYNSIGFNKHGKTEMYRELMAHLKTSDDQFILAPGIKGMVMSVFLLPSYNIVFKLIKDKFDPPKQITKAQVKTKYKLVSSHDRVGRMADTHEFEHFVFEKSRFSTELITELLEVAPSIVEITDDKIIIDHLYTERYMTPLNIFLENCTTAEAEEAVGEYGNAIKQLAAANIFPGDMLLKNFGVTRHGRVVFYDYDEIVFLTDCNFRRKPRPRNIYDEYAAEPFYSVNENDIFPEEFSDFLIGKEETRELFYKLHGDIFDVKFWRSIQKRIRDGEIVNVFPYRKKVRFDSDQGNPIS